MAVLQPAGRTMSLLSTGRWRDGDRQNEHTLPARYRDATTTTYSMVTNGRLRNDVRISTKLCSVGTSLIDSGKKRKSGVILKVKLG